MFSLVVLSDERPKNFINVGDGQTINQEILFQNHILFSTNLKQDVSDFNGISQDDEPAILKTLENKLERLFGLQQGIQKQNESAIIEALNTAIYKKGPVHINVPFDEPLYEMVDKLSVNTKVEDVIVKPKKLDDRLLYDLVDQWYNATKKMVVVGVNRPNNIEQKWLDELAEDESVIVFTETTSNIHHPDFFPSIDKIIAPLTDKEFKHLQPDILITFGGMIVSKKIKAFLRQYKPKYHWHIDVQRATVTSFRFYSHLKFRPTQSSPELSTLLANRLAKSISVCSLFSL
mgnify:CR=1 FL=1